MKQNHRHGNMEDTDSCQRKEGREWWKEGEGTSQRTCRNDPWTGTTEWRLIVGAGHGLGRGGQRGKIGTTVIH